MLHIAEFRTDEQLESLRDVWRRLWRKTPRATFQQSFEWFATYRKHLGNDLPFRVLVVTVAHKPIGILPLVVKTTASRFGDLRMLTYPISGWGTYFGPIGPHPAATLATAMRHLQQSPRDWDMIELANIDHADADRGRTPNAMRNCRFRPVIQAGSETAVINLPANWDDFADEKSAVVQNYLRAEALLAERGSIEFIHFRPEASGSSRSEYRWDLFNDFWRLMCDDPKATLFGRNISDAGRVRGFLTDLHARAVELRAVDLAMVCCDGQPVATVYNHVSPKGLENVATAASFQMRDTVSKVLWGRLIRDCIEWNDSRILLASADNIGTDWSNASVTSQCCTHFAASAARSQLLRLNTIARQWRMFKPLTTSTV